LFFWGVYVAVILVCLTLIGGCISEPEKISKPEPKVTSTTTRIQKQATTTLAAGATIKKAGTPAEENVEKIINEALHENNPHICKKLSGESMVQCARTLALVTKMRGPCLLLLDGEERVDGLTTLAVKHRMVGHAGKDYRGEIK
jgi:hypothetical protein